MSGEGNMVYKPRWGWYLYDFANSILIINGSLYFPQWFTNINHGSGDLLFNLMFSLSSILLLVVGPILGNIADKRGNQIYFLKSLSYILVLSGIGVGVAPLFDNSFVQISVAAVSFFIVLLSYQLSLVFYNSMLGSVSSQLGYGKTSGRALAWGWIGGIFAIFFGQLFVLGALPSIPVLGGMKTLLPSAILSGILIYLSIRLIEKGEHGKKTLATSQDTIEAPNEHVGGKTNSIWSEIRNLYKNKIVWYFLAGYFFFSDAILTIQNNSTIYMENVLRIDDTGKAYQFIMVLVAGAIGAIVSAWFMKRFGLKQTLIGSLVAWCVAVLITPISTDIGIFTIMFGIIGFLNGVVWNSARVIFFLIIPNGRKNSYFGIYSSFEKFASILGPIFWSMPVTFMSQDNIMRYQVAWGSMAIFLIMGIFYASKISGGKLDELNDAQSGK